MRWLVVSLVVATLACGGEAPASNSGSNSTRGTRTSNVREDTATESDRGGVDVFDASTPMRREPNLQRVDAGGAHNRDAGAHNSDAGASTQRARDAGNPSQSKSTSHPERDAATPRLDAASDLDAGREKDASSEAGAARPEEAGVAVAMNSGSCCSVSNQPGCGDAALQACVCAQRASCCSEAWTEACTRIIAEKFCQSGVRDCVCGKGQGQWQQTQCCESTWDDTCESVATNKCGASSACEKK